MTREQIINNFIDTILLGDDMILIKDPSLITDTFRWYPKSTNTRIFGWLLSVKYWKEHCKIDEDEIRIDWELQNIIKNFININAGETRKYLCIWAKRQVIKNYIKNVKPHK